jgi:predicted PurR-regulated permease PerM
MTVAVVVTAALYWAQKVLIPVALGIFLAFLLRPLVATLEHRGLRRVPAVFTVALLVLVVAAGLGWLITLQLRNLAVEVPHYTKTLKNRARFLRDMGKDSVFDQINQIASEVVTVWEEPETPDAAGESAPVPAPQAEKPVRVQVDSGWLSNILPSVPWLMEFTASGILALALVVFILVKREDLRNRLIWLMGIRRIALTTRALDDIGQRMSRFLVAQLIINVSYGVALALGLALVGLDHWILWGLLAGLLRYLPYVGAPIAALFPITLSFAQFEGWTAPLLVIAWIVLLEVVTANALEPYLFGRSVGASAVALLIAAGFWTFLWGPVGLLLSCPLTVCLVVVGEYVPALSFPAIVLGDQPALEPDVTLF